MSEEQYEYVATQQKKYTQQERDAYRQVIEVIRELLQHGITYRKIYKQLLKEVGKNRPKALENVDRGAYFRETSEITKWYGSRSFFATYARFRNREQDAKEEVHVDAAYLNIWKEMLEENILKISAKGLE